MTDYSAKKDEELIALYKRGDERAFETLYFRYERLINSIANVFYVFTGERGDLKQEGLLGLLSAVNHYDKTADGAASFFTYAYACIQNRLRSAAKGRNADRKKAESVSVPLDGILNADAFSPVPPEDGLIGKENFRESVEALKSVLSAYEAKVLDRYLTGETYTEIAEALGKSAKSVDNTLQRIKDKAKRIGGDADERFQE